MGVRMSEPRTAAPQASAAVPQAEKPCPTQPAASRWTSPFALAMFGGLLYWLALPPVNWWPLAWLAPIAWTPIVLRSTLPGRRAYLKLWFAGYLFWSAAVYWITLPHWSATIGWFFLAGYLGCYFPAFVQISRLAVHRLRVPAELAMPAVWVAMELIRAYVFTGFLMAALGHTQYQWLALIQMSDLVGAYGVSFVVMLVGVCIAQALPRSNGGRGWKLWRLVPAAFLLAAVLSYGRGRIAASEDATVEIPPSPRIALIQGTLDTQFGQPHDEYLATKKRTYEEYLGLSLAAVREAPGVGLVVWPESMYRTPLLTYHDLDAPPAHLDAAMPELFRDLIYDTAREVRAPLLLALNAEDYHQHGVEYRSASIHVTLNAITGEPKIVARYDKMHPVIFGEYVPLGEIFPWLYNLTPLSGGLTPGERAVAIEIAARDAPPLLAAPNICFESVVPHMIRRQVLQLKVKNREPDVIITQTNDGWFWGSAGLDMHLVCDVFRAVEMRKPLVTAANTGISAWIDDKGRIVEQLPRRKPGYIIAQPRRSALESPYLAGGDWFAWTCLAAATAMLFGGCLRRKSGKSGTPVPDGSGD